MKTFLKAGAATAIGILLALPAFAQGSNGGSYSGSNSGQMAYGQNGGWQGSSGNQGYNGGNQGYSSNQNSGNQGRNSASSQGWDGGNQGWNRSNQGYGSQGYGSQGYPNQNTQSFGSNGDNGQSSSENWRPG